MNKIGDQMNLKGFVRHWQTDLEGNVIPESEIEGDNTIQIDLKNYLAQVIKGDFLTESGDNISDPADLPKGNIYRVNTASVEQSAVVYPANAVFVSDGTTVTWGTGKVKLCFENKGLCNMFSSSGDGTDDDFDGMDGIGYDEGDDQITKIYHTTVNIGGDGTKSYIEFYGYHTNSTASSITLGGKLKLGVNYTAGGSYGSFEEELSSYAVSTTIGAYRKHHVYWKISF